MRFPDRGRFLDLYAGSGAVGLEAASEGFEAVLVERDAQAISLLKRNILATRLPAKLLGMDVAQFLKQAAGHGERYQVGFMAPPYRIDLLQAFERFLSVELVIPGGVAILQHPTSLVLAHGERRVYGSNTLTILRIGEV